MEFTHDAQGRINQTRTYTRNVGVNTYTNIKNFTWDSDGQLKGVEAQEPWGFTYDPNGNMLSLTYRGNTIPMEYNSVDRIIKFGEGSYKYDNRGLVIQNAREERFSYNAKGLLVRATKKGRFDVRYLIAKLTQSLLINFHASKCTPLTRTIVSVLGTITTTWIVCQPAKIITET